MKKLLSILIPLVLVTTTAQSGTQTLEEQLAAENPEKYGAAARQEIAKHPDHARIKKSVIDSVIPHFKTQLSGDVSLIHLVIDSKEEKQKNVEYKISMLIRHQFYKGAIFVEHYYKSKRSALMTYTPDGAYRVDNLDLTSTYDTANWRTRHILRTRKEK